MCILERFTYLYPDGSRAPGNRLVCCTHGTAAAPCNDTRVVHTLQDRPVSFPVAPVSTVPQAPTPPPLQTISPRTPERNQRPKKPKKGLLFFVDFHIPFTKREPREQIRRYQTVVHNDRRGMRNPERAAEYPPPPPVHLPYRPVEPQAPAPAPEPILVEARPENPRRRPQSLSSGRLHEAEREVEEERERRVNAERRARRATRAAREAEDDRIRALREVDRAGHEARLAREQRNRERAYNIERENMERLERRREREQLEREERARRRANLAERTRREEEQRRRIERAPRHEVLVHQNRDGWFGQRGEQVINDAIAAERRREDERWAAQRGLLLPRGVERRGTIGGGEGWETDRRRRWWL